MRATQLLPVLLLAACATSGTIPGDERESVRIVDNGGALQMTTYHSEGWVTHVLPAGVAEVWRVLPAAFDSLGIPVTRQDAATHTVRNDGLRLRRRLGDVPLQRYLDCGSTQGGPNAETYDIFLVLKTQVLPGENGGSRLSTAVEAQARPVNFAADWLRCTTRNTLEKALADVTARLVAGASR